jgi:hypothetical protein
MDDNTIQTTKHLIRSKQVSPLPIGPGGNNPVKSVMNDMNNQLTLMSAQASVNTKYDPPVPQPITKQVITNSVETFQVINESMIYPVSYTMFIIGSLLIVYGMIAK